MDKDQSLFFSGQPIGTLVGSGQEFGHLRAVVAFEERHQIPPLGAFLIVEHDGASPGKPEILVTRVENMNYTDYHTTADRREASLVIAYLSRLGKIGTGELTDEEKHALFFTELTLSVLGRLQKNSKGGYEFLPGLRHLPPLTARLRYPYREETKALLEPVHDQIDSQPPVSIGTFALGEHQYPQFPIRFSPARFNSRRTAVFAQTGYGKSNLSKVVATIAGWISPSGLIIFDIDGEYTRGTSKSAGLADMPFLHHRLVIFSRQAEALRRQYPGLNIHGLLDLANLEPDHLVRLLLGLEPESKTVKGVARQLRANKAELEKWLEGSGELDALVDKLVKDSKNQGPIRRALDALQPLHQHTGENAANIIINALKKGYIVILDLSGWPMQIAWSFSELIAKKFFDHNLSNMAHSDPDPVIALVEEAQNVLSNKALSDNGIFVRWAKEGRKLGLGMIYVTQQPGVIAEEIVSQTDNFFVMHLLSMVDTKALIRANPKFDGIIERFILGEPITGNAFVYSAPMQPFVFPTHVHLFTLEKMQEILGLGNFNWELLVQTLKQKGIEKVSSYERAVGMVGGVWYELLGREVATHWPGWVDHGKKWVKFKMAEAALAYMTFGLNAFPNLRPDIINQLLSETFWNKAQKAQGEPPQEEPQDESQDEPIPF